MTEQYEILEQKQIENMKTLYNKEIKLNILKDLQINKANKKETALSNNIIYKPKKIIKANKDKKDTTNKSNICQLNTSESLISKSKNNNSILGNIYPSESIYSIYSLNKSGPKDNLILLSNSK